MKRISNLAVGTWFVAASLTAALLLMSSCSVLQRSRNSGYKDQSSDQAVWRDKQNFEREASANELGYRDGHLSDTQSEAVALRTDLRNAEKTFDGQRERDQYFSNKPYMKNDRERLEFLRLGSYDARSRWLNSRGIQGSSTRHPAEIQALIDINDITVGMTKQAVRDSWGEPELVEVAGNPVYGNERWHYTEQVSSAEGFQTEHRLVVFDSGRVAGWETK